MQFLFSQIAFCAIQLTFPIDKNRRYHSAALTSLSLSLFFTCPHKLGIRTAWLALLLNQNRISEVNAVGSVYPFFILLLDFVEKCIFFPEIPSVLVGMALRDNFEFFQTFATPESSIVTRCIATASTNSVCKR